MTDRGPEVETTPARQGQTGTGARWVLRISLALIVVIFAAIWMAFFAHPRSSGNGGQELADRRISVTPNSVKQTAATAAPGSVTAQAAGRKEQTTGG